MEKQTVLITGGAGFIGSHLAERMLVNGWRVVVVDNYDDYYNPELKRANLKHLEGDKDLEVVEADIRDAKKINEILAAHKPKVVVHLAAKGGVRKSFENPSEYVEVNVSGLTNVLEAAKKNNIEQFVFASSSSVYGNRDAGPFNENDKTDGQISPYSVTKKSGELMCHVYAKIFGIKSTVLRFFTVYGPRNRPFMACSNFADAIVNDREIQIYGDGESGRDYTYIDDVVEGIMKAIDNKFDWEVINLGNSNPISVNELVAAFEKAAGKKAKVRHVEKMAGDVELTYADISKAKKLLGWEPKTSIEVGVEKLLDWYKKVE